MHLRPLPTHFSRHGSHSKQTCETYAQDSGKNERRKFPGFVFNTINTIKRFVIRS